MGLIEDFGTFCNNIQLDNLDDMEIGLPEILDMQKRRKQVLEGRVPTYISSEETQKRRHEFTNQILNQIYNKGGTK